MAKHRSMDEVLPVTVDRIIPTMLTMSEVANDPLLFTGLDFGGDGQLFLVMIRHSTEEIREAVQAALRPLQDSGVIPEHIRDEPEPEAK